MAEQIKFFEKNLVDIDTLNATITITDTSATNNGQDFVNFLRDRSNDSIWATTGSNDAANTQIDIDTVDANEFDRIILIGHNFKAFTIQYHNGSSYVDFSTPISETVNTDGTTEFQFTAVSASLIRIIITGTQVADADKVLKQLLICKSLGQLEGWPQIRKPTYSINKKQIKLLSGKSIITRQRGSFFTTLEVANYNVNTDLAILESMYFSLGGTLMWINAGDSAQFARTHISYRPEDIFLVQPKDEWNPAFYKSIYSTGIAFKMDLVEVAR